MGAARISASTTVMIVLNGRVLSPALGFRTAMSPVPLRKVRMFTQVCHRAVFGGQRKVQF